MLNETWLPASVPVCINFCRISSKRLKFCRTNIFTEIKFPLVKTTDSKAFNLMVIKLDPVETTLTRSSLA